MSTIINGRKLAKDLNLKTKSRVQQLNQESIYPGLVVIIVGDDDASQRYVRNKHLKAQKLGIKSIIKSLPKDTTQDQLLTIIQQYNQNSSINGILVQLPLPAQIDERIISYSINPQKDVDAFNPINAGKLFLNEDTFYPVPCTPSGVMEMFKKYHIDLRGKLAVVIGRSTIVGRPMASLLTNANATVISLNHYTKDIKKFTSKADIIVSATGQLHLLGSCDVKPNAVVIDVGENMNENGKLVGDVDFDQVSKIAGYITPVPGGVGPMTIAMLMKQTVDLAVWSEKNGR
ncbi:bifunctional protein FolD [Philodulcilactobacillus myokoensis]|uniref:Bifunctional protein FolD n=1 Tax=Philodulcilactobacillus myokoensis TaxID=2929573 RepID=A0A9W6B1I7_9LACO|nr:tetrahydrofolate dehydrogenase/cyclohydrolase catalytic domain-containing protein [Philodulcilactobacillus myokoensis]GLB46800.1 bifunctional protein FolD [Philodulcilactobacillus myokoensis]